MSGQCMCGAYDCRACYGSAAESYGYDEEEEEELETTSTRYVVARKARGRILPGDLVRVTSGFSYEKDGPRTGYFRYETLVGYGPGHGSEKMGSGYWSPRGGFQAVHPLFADAVEAREAA